MSIIEEVKNFVESEYKNPGSKYGFDPFLFHLAPVVKYCLELADELGGDKEILEIAGWMHDIGSIIYGRENHHITSAEIAEKKLRELNYPEDRIKKVKECIISHRGSQKIKPESIEAKILIEADTLSAFGDIAGLFQCAYSYEKLSRAQAKKSVIDKLENKWNQLNFENSRQLIKPKFDATMLLLKEGKYF